MNVILTIGRSAAPRSKSVYLDFQRHEVSRGKYRARLWPKAFMMVSAILVSPHRLTGSELVSFIYDDMPDGGPIWANRCVWHFLWHARKRLQPLGIGIKWRTGYGPVDLWGSNSVPPPSISTTINGAKVRALVRAT